MLSSRVASRSNSLDTGLRIASVWIQLHKISVGALVFPFSIDLRLPLNESRQTCPCTGLQCVADDPDIPASMLWRSHQGDRYRSVPTPSNTANSLELEREVLPSSAVEDVDLPIVPLVHHSLCTFGMRGCSRLLLHRHGRHCCLHNVRDDSDVVGSKDHGC